MSLLRNPGSVSYDEDVSIGYMIQSQQWVPPVELFGPPIQSTSSNHHIINRDSLFGKPGVVDYNGGLRSGTGNPRVSPDMQTSFPRFIDDLLRLVLVRPFEVVVKLMNRLIHEINMFMTRLEMPTTIVAMALTATVLLNARPSPRLGVR